QGAYGEEIPITWTVLQRDKDFILVIAKQGLDSMPYHESVPSITWADCSLRHWLNNEFLNKAFNDQERERILLSSLTNNAGPDTEDRVFLLSAEDAEDGSLFAGDTERQAKPTKYASNKKAYTDEENGCCSWWLRSRGCYGHHAASVSTGGDVNIDGDEVSMGSLAVRPALRISLKNI
ncbi:serine/threonine protein kinase, partial [bacterium]|nr:serine/threonine protein kinase [bacterium]